MRSAPVAGLSDTALVELGAGVGLTVILAAAIVAPWAFWWLLLAAAAAGLVCVALRFTEALTVAWLVVAGATLEMTLSDVFGGAWFQPTIAAVKAAGIGLAAVAALRWGTRLDAFNPAWVWLAMFLGGWVHGLYPGLTIDDSLRSLIGSIAPFMFGFARVSRRWADRVIAAAAWLPLASVAAGGVLDAAAIRPLFVDSAGLRLAGLGHPAFLAGVTQTAIYAGLIELFRRGRRGDLLLLGGNFLILLLTGARAPLTYALAVAGLALLLAPSRAYPLRRRLLPVLGAGSALALAALAACLTGADLSAIRAFNVLEIGVGNLSGRQILWPNFAEAAAQSPWLGWGVGAGNVIIPEAGEVARLLHTWAAHNEYLRVAAEGGQLGRSLLVAMFVLWVHHHTARLNQAERLIMRLVFVAFAAHALTDNLLISTPACVFFAFATAVFARGGREAEANHRLPDSRGQA